MALAGLLEKGRTATSRARRSGTWRSGWCRGIGTGWSARPAASVARHARFPAGRRVRCISPGR